MLLNNSVAFKIGDEVRSRRTRNHKSIEGKVTDFKKEKVLVQYGHHNNEKWFDASELELVASLLDIAPPTDENSTLISGGFKVGDRIYTSFGKKAAFGQIKEIRDERARVCFENEHPNGCWVGLKYLKLQIVPVEELDAVIAEIEKEDEECSHSLTCAVESEPDFPLQDCNLDLNSLDSQKLTSTAHTFLVSDSPEFTTTETSKPFDKMTLEEIFQKDQLLYSQPALPANPFQSKETDSEQLMSETASPQLSERSQLSDHDISVLRMSQDSLTVLTAQENSKEPISGILCGSYTNAGTMRSGSLLAAEALQRPGLDSDYCWLESPGALSCPGKNRPPGLSRLESQLKKLGALQPKEVCNPEFLERGFQLPTGWTNPQVTTTAGEFLAKIAQSVIAEPPSVTPSIQESQPSPFAESSTSTLLLSDQAQNPPELKAKGRAISFGWTSNQLLAGLKNCTRRTWKDSYAKYFIKAFNEGRTIPALNKDYRYGGKVIGHLRLTCCPYKEKLSDMPGADLQAEGGMCATVDQFIKKYFKGDDNLSVWVIRFEFQPLDFAPSSSQHDDQHRAQQPQNPPELKQSWASGWLEPYIKSKKLKSGIVASYPRVEGHRNPDDPHHWYWAYKYEEKSENAISDNGCITRAVSVPPGKVLGVKNAISNRQPVQKILQLIRGEI